MGRTALFASLLVAATAISACGTAGSTGVPATETTGSITWTRCGEVQCANLSVPLDVTRPNGPRITLALARRRASGKRIGVLLTNPGGPGASGVDTLRAGADAFPAEIRRHFDIVSWDPRGVGASAPIHCLDDLDAFYAVDRDPHTAAAVTKNIEAARQFVDACRRRSASLLPYVSTAATVHDLDAIRNAMGENQISYLGFSYGTLIGAMYADAYPTHLRAMVLDGAVDPSLDDTDATIQQSASFERDLAAFLAHCRQGCGFAQGADPSVAFDSLSDAVRAEPQYAVVDGESRMLGPGEFDIGVASALYDGRDGWSGLGAALAEAARGSGDQLLSLSDLYTERSTGGKYAHETAAGYAIGCLDSPSPATVADVKQLAAEAARVSPHFGASTAWLGLPCTFWPVHARGRAAPIAAPRAPPILVVGTTDDPATPYSWAESLARQLRSGRLLTVVGDSHTSYGRGDDCVDQAVDHYLEQLTLPDAGTRCN